MTMGFFHFITPVHPTVQAEFLILITGDTYTWEMKRPGDEDRISGGGYATLADCEKGALQHLRSLPPMRSKSSVW